MQKPLAAPLQADAALFRLTLAKLGIPSRCPHERNRRFHSPQPRCTDSRALHRKWEHANSECGTSGAGLLRLAVCSPDLLKLGELGHIRSCLSFAVPLAAQTRYPSSSLGLKKPLSAQRVASWHQRTTVTASFYPKIMQMQGGHKGHPLWQPLRQRLFFSFTGNPGGDIQPPREIPRRSGRRQTWQTPQERFPHG